MCLSQNIPKKKDELMQIKIYFLVINIYLLSCFNIACAKTNTFNLLNLLQHPAAKTLVDEKPKVQNVGVQAKNVAVVSPKKTINELIDNIAAEQSNASYQDALKILSDQSMRAAYHDDLVSIQLFLLDYITQILQKYSVQDQKKQKSMSLTDLLQKIVPKLPSDAQHQLSHLTDLLQKKSLATAAHVPSHINLEHLLQKEVAAVPVKPKSQVHLNKLLKIAPHDSVVHILKPHDSIVHTLKPIKKSDNLLNLLTAG